MQLTNSQWRAHQCFLIVQPLAANKIVEAKARARSLLVNQIEADFFGEGEATNGNDRGGQPAETH